MGDPKRPSNVFKKPRRPWSSDQLVQELEIVGTYGLRNKRELWRAQTELSRIRKQARALLALPHEVRHAKETELLRFLNRLGLVAEEATLDDILNLKIQDLLERRLQSVVIKKKLAKTPSQARQAVVHGHIAVNDRTINIPGYIVKREEEPGVAVRGGSSYVVVAAPAAPAAAESTAPAAAESTAPAAAESTAPAAAESTEEKPSA